MVSTAFCVLVTKLFDMTSRVKFSVSFTNVSPSKESRREGKVQGCRATDPRPSEKTSGLGEVSVLTDHFSSSRATELSCKCV